MDPKRKKVVDRIQRRLFSLASAHGSIERRINQAKTMDPTFDKPWKKHPHTNPAWRNLGIEPANPDADLTPRDDQGRKYVAHPLGTHVISKNAPKMKGVYVSGKVPVAELEDHMDRIQGAIDRHIGHLKKVKGEHFDELETMDQIHKQRTLYTNPAPYGKYTGWHKSHAGESDQLRGERAEFLRPTKLKDFDGNKDPMSPRDIGGYASPSFNITTVNKIIGRKLKPLKEYKRFGSFLKENSKIPTISGRTVTMSTGVKPPSGQNIGISQRTGKRLFPKDPGPEYRSPTRKAQIATPPKATAPKQPTKEKPKQDCYGELCVNIERAETGSFKNKFIRTVGVPGSSSTAFGPMQITGTTLKDMTTRHPENFPDKDYTKSLIDQSKKFAKYGREPKKKGYEKRWDYGGSGDPKTHDPEKYREVGVGVLKGMAKDIFGEVPKELTPQQREELVTRWRGKSRKDDPRYFGEVDKGYKK